MFKCYSVDIGGTLISQIHNQSVSTDLAEVYEKLDNSVYNTFHAIGNQQDTFSFTTTMVSTALSKITADGFKIGGTGNTLTAYFQQRAKGGRFEGANKHLKITATEGLLLPRTLAAESNQPATLDAEFIAIYDESNDPLVFLKNQSLAGDPTAAELFTAGAMKDGEGFVNKIQSINIDFGISAPLESPDGIGRPTFISINEIQPVITITTNDIDVLDTYETKGVKKDNGAIVIFLRAFNSGGIREADNTEKHIKITVGECRVHASEGSGDRDGNATAVIRIVPVYDGTNNPLQMAYDQKIA